MILFCARSVKSERWKSLWVISKNKIITMVARIYKTKLSSRCPLTFQQKQLVCVENCMHIYKRRLVSLQIRTHIFLCSRWVSPKKIKLAAISDTRNSIAGKFQSRYNKFYRNLYAFRNTRFSNARNSYDFYDRDTWNMCFYWRIRRVCILPVAGSYNKNLL